MKKSDREDGGRRTKRRGDIVRIKGYKKKEKLEQEGRQNNRKNKDVKKQDKLRLKKEKRRDEIDRWTNRDRQVDTMRARQRAIEKQKRQKKKEEKR